MEHEQRNSTDASIYTRLGNLEQDVAALEARLQSIALHLGEVSTGVKDIARNFAERGKTDWKVIAGLGSVLMMVIIATGSLALTPIRAQLTRLEVRVTEDEVRMDTYISDQHKTHLVQAEQSGYARARDDFLADRVKSLLDLTIRDIGAYRQLEMENAFGVRDRSGRKRVSGKIETEDD